MALFGPFYVTTTLTLSKKQENALVDAAGALGLIGEHTHGLELAVEAILAKLTEDPEPVVVGPIVAGDPVEQPGA